MNMVTFSYLLVATGTVQPVNIATTSHTPVTIIGRNYTATTGIKCQFDSVIVPASIQSDRSLVCVAPTLAEGNVTLSIMGDGGAPSSFKIFYYGIFRLCI